VTADQFVLMLIADDIDTVLEVVQSQAAAFMNPAMTTSELLDGLKAVGLTASVPQLRARPAREAVAPLAGAVAEVHRPTALGA
jgi:hypothetical protein